MNEVKKAKISLELSNPNKGLVECEAMVKYGNLNNPEELVVFIGGLKPDEIINLVNGKTDCSIILKSPKVKVILEDNVQFQTEITFIKGVKFDGQNISFNCMTGPVIMSFPVLIESCQFWKFRLTNLRLFSGDLSTYQPPTIETIPPENISEYQDLIAKHNKTFGCPALPFPEILEKYKNFKVKGSYRLNRIEFNYANRKWLLDDDLFGQSKENLDKIAVPVVSGTLSTEFEKDDSEEDLKNLATEICDLLSFALARDIKWASQECCNGKGESQKVFQHAPVVFAFNQHGITTIDNWDTGNLKNLLENAYEKIQKDKNWWAISFGLLMQARVSKFLEVKCSLLNTLLDRISSKVIGDNFGNEIDSNLDMRLDRNWFRWLLHRLLRSLSKNWGKSRTDSLCEQIKKWNAEPSFPDKVIRACDSLGIPYLARNKLGFRHKLIHSGEMNKKLKTIDQKVDYLFGIEAMVLLKLIMMLKFSGQIYLQINPPKPKLVADFLKSK